MNIATATQAILPPLVALCSRNRLKVLLIAALLAAGSLWATKTWLGVTTDTGGMFAASLPWKQRTDALAHLFPQNDDLIVAVVSGRIPEEAEATAAALAARLRQDHVHFQDVRQPDTLPYLQKNAFLLIDTGDLEDVLNRTIDAQPFLGELAADPSLRGLFSALGLVVQGVEHNQSLADVAPALGKFHAALASSAAGHPQALSWEELLAGKLADQAGRFRFVLCKPVLDYGALQPGGAATRVVRQAAAEIPWVRSGDARVRLTGSVVMDDEEFATVAKGAVAGLVGSFLLVLVWLYLAVRSWRLMIPIIATLLLGLLLTTGFAAIAIGTLNLISVAFAVLFVGLAVDFAIQFSVRLRERRFTYPGLVDGMRETGRRSGAQILVAALATASGFLAFTPTNFVGVAQLGIIAGVGMLIAFTCTLTFLPAMLCLCHPRRERQEVGFAFARAMDPVLHRYRYVVVAGFAVLALAGAICAPFIRFDGDPLHTKDPHSEAIRVLRDLMQDPITNPYTIEALLPSLAAAQTAGEKLAKLPLSDEVLTLNSFLPTDQDKKLALIQDAASILGPTLAPPATLPPVSAAAFRQAAVTLAAALDHVAAKLAPNDPLRLIGGDLQTLSHASDATLLSANQALTEFLPLQLGRLRLALTAQHVVLADIPPELRRDWVLPDGRARLQVLPKAAVQDGHTLRSWVKAALKVVPECAGSAVWILKSADTITTAFRIAAYSALGAITIILLLALRRVLDVALVLIPLMMSALLTTLLLRLFGMSLNFANIIALPLLLGVGVSFNIYFVMNWRSGVHRYLGSATARAVMFSALTTSTAFGSLALSQHPGTASMGVLLLMSLGCTVVTTLVFTPAMLQLVPAPHVALGGYKEEVAVLT
jgi:hopanoid biosynthesis associated RND transporter like protein HpnN